MTNTEKQAEIALHALRKAVAHTFRVKRRLGQYIVMEKDGKPVCVPSEKIPSVPENG